MLRRTRAALPGLPLLAALAAACGVGRPQIYTHPPSQAPLRYADQLSGSQSVETPAGSQGGDYTVETKLGLELGPATDGRQSFVLSVDEFSAEMRSAMGSMPVDGTVFKGLRITGTLAPDGGIQLGEIPDATAGTFDALTLAGVLPDLLAPLPPDGKADAAPWPHRFAMPLGGGLKGETSYVGEARFAGDTTFNGIPVRRIVSEGKVEVAGSGTPPGSPSEIDLSVGGDSRTVYLWDAARGLLVAADSESELAGTVTAMGFDLPMTIAAKREIRLLP